jgi:cytosine/adenosine deaminase-related metal-dependent hydrolase
MEPAPESLTLAHAKLPNGTFANIEIAGGLISRLSPPGATIGGRTIDLAGAVVLPRLVDGHVHLDKTLLGTDWVAHVGGDSVPDRIRVEKAVRKSLRESMEARAQKLLERVIVQGTLALRSHVDIDDEIKLGHLESLLQLKQRNSALVDLQLVAFPQSGVTSLKGGAELLDAALTAGADCLGGLDPAGIDSDIEGQLEVLFRLAVKHEVGLDIHLHDPGELGAYELRRIAEKTRAEGLEGKVAVSHAYALGAVRDATFGHTAEQLARAQVAIMTNGPGTESLPPVKRLIAAGVTVFAGSDNIQDSWSPYGDGDMLGRVRHIGFLCGLQTDAELNMALALTTTNAALVLGFAAVGVREGEPADLVVVRAQNVHEAVAAAPPRQLVIRAGRVVARDGVLLEDLR